MAGKKYSAATKAAVAADLAVGMTIQEAADKHGVSYATAATLTPTSKTGRVYLERTIEVNELQILLSDLLRENIAALRSTVRQAHNATWRNKQTAGELATFYGVIFDKTGKIAGFAVAGPAMDRAALPDAESGSEAGPA